MWKFPSVNISGKQLETKNNLFEVCIFITFVCATFLVSPLFCPFLPVFAHIWQISFIFGAKMCYTVLPWWKPIIKSNQMYRTKIFVSRW